LSFESEQNTNEQSPGLRQLRGLAHLMTYSITRPSRNRIFDSRTEKNTDKIKK
jgi:hypothetical protein